MKKLIYAFVFMANIVLSLQCQKELSIAHEQLPGNNNKKASPITATLQGNIIDENNGPAAGVSILIGSRAVLTDSKGYFRITDAPLDKNNSIVTAEKTGYFKTYRSFRATSGVNQVVIKLIKKKAAGVVYASAGGKITLPNGSEVSLPAGGIVKASGNTAYSGNVTVYAAYIDPTSSDINSIVPGSFMADDKDNNRVTLASYGMLAVELEGTTGEKLQISTGSKATLTTPIPLSLLSSAPATIPLWYVAEETGAWKEEGVATRNGNNYIGEVKHFSFWNCDINIPAVSVSLTVQTNEGNPLVFSQVRITALNSEYLGQADGWTDSLGQVSGLVPANQNLLLEILAYPCSNVIYTKNIGPLSDSSNLGTIIVPPVSTSLQTINGKLVNCSNEPVTDGYAIINHNNLVYYAATDNNGNFTISFTNCSSSTSAFDIVAVDESAQQQSSVTTLPFTGSVTSTANMAACGTSSAQYINYTLDGTDYSITRPGDSLYAYSYLIQNTPPNLTSFYGMKQNVYIGFSYLHSNASGSFPLSNLAVQGYDSIVTFIQPFNITITKYPSAPGEFYEGSFTGQFKHSTTGTALHNIDCSFKVRKDQ